MSFPVVFDVGGLHIPAHPVFELLAYLTGFGLLWWLRRRGCDEQSSDARLGLSAAAILGAVVGSKLLHHLNHPTLLAERVGDPSFLFGGKTIVGGLLGGWLGVEFYKRRAGIVRRTGDVYVWPICLAIAVGRIGCFLTGVEDGTHGVRTSSWFGMDLGDGVARHPAALYEIVFVVVLACVFSLLRRRALPSGALFRLFCGAYLAFRVAVDCLKPGERFFGLTMIQWAAAVGSLWAFCTWRGSVPEPSHG